VNAFLAVGASGGQRQRQHHAERHQRRHRRGREQRRTSPLHGNQLPADHRAQHRADTAHAQAPADAGGAQRGRVIRGGQRIHRRLPTDNAKTCHEHHRHQQRQRRRHMADQRHGGTGDQEAHRQHAHETEAVDQAAQRERADHAAHLQGGRHQHRGVRRVTRIADQRRQPVRQEVQVDQVHEVDDPQHQRDLGAALGEQRRDRHAVRGRLGHHELRLRIHLQLRSELAQPACEALMARLRITLEDKILQRLGQPQRHHRADHQRHQPADQEHRLPAKPRQQRRAHEPAQSRAHRKAARHQHHPRHTRARRAELTGQRHRVGHDAAQAQSGDKAQHEQRLHRLHLRGGQHARGKEEGGNDQHRPPPEAVAQHAKDE
jgi:hypothetical protein